MLSFIFIFNFPLKNYRQKCTLLSNLYRRVLRSMRKRFVTWMLKHNSCKMLMQSHTPGPQRLPHFCEIFFFSNGNAMQTQPYLMRPPTLSRNGAMHAYQTGPGAMHRTPSSTQMGWNRQTRLSKMSLPSDS